MELPEATGDRLFVISDDDRRGSLWVVSVICCAYVLLLMVLRATARRANFGADDYLATAATCTGIIHFAFTFLAISNHLGTPISDLTGRQAYTVGMAYVTSDVFMLFTLFFTKCAVIVLCRRLFSINMRQHRIICDATVGIVALWCVGSIMGAVVSCGKLDRIGFMGQSCSNMMLRWRVIGIVDAITELLIIVLALVVVIPLRMSINKKAAAALAFIPRLLLIPLIAVHLRTLNAGIDSFSIPGDRTTWSRKLTNVTIYREVQVVYALFTAALPALNRLLRKFDTSMGHFSSGDSSGYGRDNNGAISTTTSSRGYGIRSKNRGQPSATTSALGAGSRGPAVLLRQESYQLHDIDRRGGGGPGAQRYFQDGNSNQMSGPAPLYSGTKTKMFSRTFRPDPSHYVASAEGPGAYGRSPMRERGAFEELGDGVDGAPPRKGNGQWDGVEDDGARERRERERDSDGGSVDSQAKIIRKDVTWEVRGEVVR